MYEAEPIVFVVDDDESVRESLKLLIEAAGWQAQTFPSALAFLRRPPARVPSCLLLDLVLPDLNGCDLQGLLTDKTDMPVIFITGHGDVHTTVRAMKGGAVDFFIKPVNCDALLSAIGNALDRSCALLGQAADERALQENYASLSSREREVLALVAAGLLNKQVACALGISEITVKAHRGRLMRKMNADSFAALVRMADKLCLTPAPVDWRRAKRGSLQDDSPGGPMQSRLRLRYARTDLKPARSSSEKSCGCSQAAKWPPLSSLL
jgi:FixJ family two-component response regulator